MNINLTMIGQTLTFAVFVWFSMKYIWPPIVEALATRHRMIVEGLAAGERGRHELELAAKGSTAILRNAKTDAADIVARAEEHWANIVDEARTAARAEGDRQLAAARAEIELEVFRARETLRIQIAQLAIAIAEKVVAREVDVQAHAAMIETALGEL